MSRVWYNAINDAHKKDLIEAPGVMSTSNTCDKEYGDGIYGGITQKGSGEDDGIYYHSSESKGVILEYEIDNDDPGYAGFVGLFHSDRDDFVKSMEVNGVWLHTVWRNTGSEEDRFEQMSGYLDFDDSCHPRGIRWIDINGKSFLATEDITHLISVQLMAWVILFALRRMGRLTQVSTRETVMPHTFLILNPSDCGKRQSLDMINLVLFSVTLTEMVEVITACLMAMAIWNVGAMVGLVSGSLLIPFAERYFGIWIIDCWHQSRRQPQILAIIGEKIHRQRDG
jgi:hypothetical protein